MNEAFRPRLEAVGGKNYDIWDVEGFPSYRLIDQIEVKANELAREGKVKASQRLFLAVSEMYLAKLAAETCRGQDST